MQVTQIIRYPVKSMAGEMLTEAQMTENGIPGDRAWAVRDLTRNNFKLGKRCPQMMDCAPSFTREPSTTEPSPPVTIQLPNGTQLTSADDNTNAALSTLLETDAQLCPLLPPADKEHYRRQTPAADDEMADARTVFARTADEPLPDLRNFPAELFEYESKPGTYFDAFPVLIMSEGGLRALVESAPAQNFDVRRFRPTIMVDDATQSVGFAEDAWVGQELQIGSLRLKVELPCPRCIMTTHGFADLAKDPKIMRSLVKQHGGDLGVYASISQPGRFAVGDAVEVVG